MDSGVLKFPELGKRAWEGPRLSPPQVLQKFDAPDTVRLLDVCRSVIDQSLELLIFVDAHREAARRAGIETIAIELSAVLEGGGLDRILDSLEESVLKGRPTAVTVEGLARLRRTESLLAEAASNITKHTAPAVLPAVAPVLKGDAPAKSGDGLLWVPFVAIGTVAVVAVIVLAVFPKVVAR